jgi:hypothetical protein
MAAQYGGASISVGVDGVGGTVADRGMAHVQAHAFAAADEWWPSAKRNTPCHALQDFYLADALPHQ